MKRVLLLVVIELIASGCSVPRTGLPETELQSREERVRRVGAKIVEAANEICTVIEVPDRCPKGVEFVDQAGINVYSVIRPTIASAFTGVPNAPAVLVTAETLDIIENDSELALLIAHEFAHGIMGHVGTTGGGGGGIAGFIMQTQKTTIGRKDQSIVPSTEKRILSLFASSPAYRETYELDADYLSFYFVARAGYSVSEALDIWNTPANEKTKYYFATVHLVTENRAELARRTMAEISQKKRGRKPLLPDLEY